MNRISTLLFFLFLSIIAAAKDTPREYYKKHYESKKYHELVSNSFPHVEMKDENCFYVINSIFDLNGSIVRIPKESVLYFGDNGGFKGGILILSDDCHLIGGRFGFSHNDAAYEIYHGAKMRSPIVIIDANNVKVEDCEFYYSAIEERPSPSIMVYGKEGGCRNIVIKNNTFHTSGIAFFCNVRDSYIDNNIFDNMLRAIRVETMYDTPPYRSPKNIIITNNFIHGRDSDLARNLVWISGVKNISFRNNTIDSYRDAVILYCGDGYIALDKINVTGNQFTIKESANENNQYKHCLLVRGKSYPFQKRGTTLGKDVIVDNNQFISEENCSQSQSFYNRAIGVNFVNDIRINDNVARNFSTFIAVTDDFRDLKERSTNISIKGNHIYSTYENPIRFSTDIKTCRIEGNVFEECNNKSNYEMDVSNISDLKVISNYFIVPRKRKGKYIKTKPGFSVKQQNNKVILR